MAAKVEAGVQVGVELQVEAGVQVGVKLQVEAGVEAQVDTTTQMTATELSEDPERTATMMVKSEISLVG